MSSDNLYRRQHDDRVRALLPPVPAPHAPEHTPTAVFCPSASAGSPRILRPQSTRSPLGVAGWREPPAPAVCSSQSHQVTPWRSRDCGQGHIAGTGRSHQWGAWLQKGLWVTTPQPATATSLRPRHRSGRVSRGRRPVAASASQACSRQAPSPAEVLGAGPPGRVCEAGEDSAPPHSSQCGAPPPWSLLPACGGLVPWLVRDSGRPRALSKEAEVRACSAFRPLVGDRRPDPPRVRTLSPGHLWVPLSP